MSRMGMAAAVVMLAAAVAGAQPASPAAAPQPPSQVVRTRPAPPVAAPQPPPRGRAARPMPPVAGLLPAQRTGLVQELLRRVPDWPGTEVEVPAEVYEEYVRDAAFGPAPPKPPADAWVERAEWRVRIAGREAVVEAALEVAALPGMGSASVAVLPASVVWSDVTVNGRPATLRRADDGWFYFDVPASGVHRIAAKAARKAETSAEPYRLVWAAPRAAWTTLAVESDEAWDVRAAGAVFPVVGDVGGTRGTLGLAPGARIAVTWQRPQPPVRRAARIESETHVGWTLADGVHQVRAVLDLRLWGGEAEELTLALGPGAERVAVTGPDVREVQVQGGQARVLLRGAIRQRTRLGVAFEVPRPATGPMTLPPLGVEGASPRGGTLAVAGGAGGVILEMDSPGLSPMALRDLPEATRSLLSAAPVYAYALAAGAWEARIDLVSMAEFPVRETLIDSALYTVLYRPDGRVMAKVLYEVRNRAQQYMRVDLPAGARLVVARVAEGQKNLARGPGDTVFVPLEKSVLTTAGLVSFPVELVYVMPAEALARRGRLRLPLPRTDLPAAYARCALMVPEGLHVRRWEGVLREVEAWSSETAELEFEYGHGHLAAGLARATQEDVPAARPEPGRPTKAPGLLERLAWFFGGGGGAAAPAALGAAFEPPSARPPAPDGTRVWDLDERANVQAQVLQAKNLYRAGVDAYQRQDYGKAREFFRQVAEAAPKSSEAENAGKYLGNIDIATGEDVTEGKGDRTLRAAAKAVRMTQQAANVEVLERQQQLLARADVARKAGDEGRAEAAYKVAVDLARQLRARGEVAHEQEATVRGAMEFLRERDRSREEQQRELADLQAEVHSLKQSIVTKGGQEVAQAVDALVTLEGGGLTVARSAPAPAFRGSPAGAPETQPSSQGARSAAEEARPAPAAPQIEMNRALAEQQVTLDLGSAVRFSGSGRSQAGGGSGPAVARIEHLKKEVEKLKSISGFVDTNGDWALRSARPEDGPARDASAPAATAALGRQLADKAQDVAARANAAKDLVRQGRLAEARDLLGVLEQEEQTTSRAAEALGLRPTTYPRYPDRDQWKTTRSLDDARRHVTDAKEELARKGRELDRVRFDVRDLARNEGEGRKLAEFVTSNYSWALRPDRPIGQAGAPPPAGAGSGTPAVRLGGATPGGPDIAWSDFANASGHGVITLYDAQAVNLSGQAANLAGNVALQMTDGSTLAVANDPAAVAQVEAVLDRLRANLGQRVAVGSRNVFVDAPAAGAAGFEWREGTNGVRYAVVNEGQLRALVDLEQWAPNAFALSRPRGLDQDAVVGTAALAANGAVVAVAGAGDEANTLDYFGNTVTLAHDEYLVVDNGGYLTAVKTGQMRHWEAGVERPKFPDVPAVVVVPRVGRTVKFEKTLLDTSDALELVAEYAWQGEE